MPALAAELAHSKIIQDCIAFASGLNGILFDIGVFVKEPYEIFEATIF